MSGGITGRSGSWNDSVSLTQDHTAPLVGLHPPPPPPPPPGSGPRPAYQASFHSLSLSSCPVPTEVIFNGAVECKLLLWSGEPPRHRVWDTEVGPWASLQDRQIFHLISFHCFPPLLWKDEWGQVEEIQLVNDGSGLGFGIVGGKTTGVVVRTLVPNSVADRVRARSDIKVQKRFEVFGLRLLIGSCALQSGRTSANR